MDQYVQEAHHDIDRDSFPSRKYKSISTAGSGSYNNGGCFDCNICLDNAQDPVVTLCGHLYCWPCLYKWLHFQSESAEEEQPQQPQPQCPVCKADVSITTVIPLYSGSAFSPGEESNNKESSMDIKIPNRPPAGGIHTLLTTSTAHQIHGHAYHLESQLRSNQNQRNYPRNRDSFTSMAAPPSPVVSVRGLTAHPIVGMFGEMVHARIFGNSAEVGLYGYPNAHHLMDSSNPRVRRQEIKVEKSLNRISIFLLCCVILCLLLF